MGIASRYRTERCYQTGRERHQTRLLVEAGHSGRWARSLAISPGFTKSSLGAELGNWRDIGGGARHTRHFHQARKRQHRALQRLVDMLLSADTFYPVRVTFSVRTNHQRVPVPGIRFFGVFWSNTCYLWYNNAISFLVLVRFVFYILVILYFLSLVHRMCMSYCIRGNVASLGRIFMTTELATL